MQMTNMNQGVDNPFFVAILFGKRHKGEKSCKNVGQCRNKFGIIKTSKEIITLEKKKGESL